MEVPRLLHTQLLADADRGFVTVLLGARQVGKSYLMRRIAGELSSAGRQVAFFDLEQPSVLRDFSRDEERSLAILREAGDVVFIDEFQYLRAATRVLKALLDGPRSPKVYVSGSSSIEIHRHLTESLAGRHRVRLLHPLSWADEYARVPGARLVDYLAFGGMPGTIHENVAEGKRELLSSILQSYILKDIRGLVREENIGAFNVIMYSLAQEEGQVIRPAALAGDARVSEPTVARHLDILSATYVTLQVPSYSTNLANELRKSRKVYLYDPGMRNAILKDFRPAADRPDRGAIHEAFVARALWRRLGPDTELRFWRSTRGEEVDFVLVADRLPVPVEVKSSWDPGELPPGLKAFLKRHPEAGQAWIFTAGGESGSRTWQGARIDTRPLVEAETFQIKPRGGD